MLGRMLTESNPETGKSGTNGTATYTYDSVTCAGTAIASAGDLVQKTDNAGNMTCYTYDGLHRVLTAGNSTISGATLRKFVYDTASATPPSGWTATSANAKTHMVEATTTNTSGTTVTDEWFMYDPRGELTNLFESTPHSSGYYHTIASYWASGAPVTLSGIPGVPTINYGASGAGLDGEGRYTEVTAASGTNPVTSVTYSTSSTTNPLGALTAVTLGSADSDSFTYDPNTGRAGSYTFSVNGKTDVGTLTWNTNGTLGKLVITDGLNASNSQTCTYTHDDLARVSGTSCSSSPAWSQTFTYDAFGNISKSGSISFLPGYTFSNGAITNQFNSITGVSVAYDKNGNLLTDNLNTYTWDPNWGNPASINSTNLVYDALGQMVEEQNGSAYTQILYSPVGKTALMSGQTLTKAFVNLPGGATAIYNSTGLAYYRHTDWLGSSRLTSTASRTVYSDLAYAPFGEQYAPAGTADPSFTGENSDTVSSLYDFEARRYSPSQGRWISPDPAGLAAASPMSPQSWNRYAYVLNNPLALLDPSGLDCITLNPDGSYFDSGDGNGDCPGVSPDNEFYYPAPVDLTSVQVTTNGDLLATVDGVPNQCSGECSTPFVGTEYVNVNASIGNGLASSGGGDNGGGHGANNGTPQQVQQQTQKCIQQFYSSGVGQATQFGSPLSLIPSWNSNASSNLGEWATAIFGKVGGTFGAGIYTGTEQIATLNGTTSVASTLEIGTHAFLGGLAKLASFGTLAATGMDVIAHAGCATVARQNAGQMTPLPPGITF